MGTARSLTFQTLYSVSKSVVCSETVTYNSVYMLKVFRVVAFLCAIWFRLQTLRAVKRHYCVINRGSEDDRNVSCMYENRSSCMRWDRKIVALVFTSPLSPSHVCRLNVMQSVAFFHSHSFHFRLSFSLLPLFLTRLSCEVEA